MSIKLKVAKYTRPMHDAFLPTMCFKLPTVTHYIRLGMVIARVRYAHTNSVALTKFSFVLSRKTYSCPVQKRPKTYSCPVQKYLHLHSIINLREIETVIGADESDYPIKKSKQDPRYFFTIILLKFTQLGFRI